MANDPNYLKTPALSAGRAVPVQHSRRNDAFLANAAAAMFPKSPSSVGREAYRLEGSQMQNGERAFYTSENGDRWLLLAGEDVVSVRHVPNAASGGQRKTYELGAFLIEERHSAQNQALRALISSLTRTEESHPAAAQE